MAILNISIKVVLDIQPTFIGVRLVVVLSESSIILRPPPRISPSATVGLSSIIWMRHWEPERWQTVHIHPRIHWKRTHWQVRHPIHVRLKMQYVMTLTTSLWEGYLKVRKAWVFVHSPWTALPSWRATMFPDWSWTWPAATPSRWVSTWQGVVSPRAPWWLSRPWVFIHSLWTALPSWRTTTFPIWSWTWPTATPSWWVSMWQGAVPSRAPWRSSRPRWRMATTPRMSSVRLTRSVRATTSSSFRCNWSLQGMAYIPRTHPRSG